MPMKRLILLSGLIPLLCAGCARDEPILEPAGQGSPPEYAEARTELRDMAGRSVGQATATQVGDSVRIWLEGSGLPQGAHGAHIHQVGVCAAPSFESAGPHWNPTNARHGKDNPAGMHRGDLPNILIGTDGRGSVEYVIPGARLGSMIDRDGAALVIHAQADDYRTDPSGNSGARIACGVLR
jgi:Cu-Zn family superoxide dismutase